MGKSRRRERSRSGPAEGLSEAGSVYPSADDARVVFLVIAVKLALLVFGVHALGIFQGTTVSFGRGWLEVWNRWDAPHYLDIAQDGYVAHGEARKWIVFFPLFPWLVRLAGFLGVSGVTAAFLVSGVATVALGVLLLRLARLDGISPPWVPVAALFAFPTGYFLHIGYTESLFLALCIGAFVAARRGCWWAAALLGFFASLTRINGLVLYPALLCEALSQRDRRLPALMWLLLVPAGFGTYLLLNHHVFGDPLMFLSFQREFWHKSLAPPWVGLRGAWGSFTGRAPQEALMVGFYECAFAFGALGCTIWSTVRQRRSYAVWMGGNWLLMTSTSFLLSAPRYCLALFPAFLLLGSVASRRWAVAWVLTVLSLLWLGLFAIRFVTGAWAF
jgi:hypothetical protein